MSDIAIRVDKLSKLYRIGAAQAQHDTLRDAVTGIFRRRPSPLAHRPSDTDLWALKDVSFDVKPGEVVGIIGRNGAGKSTLLKILSRITEPTSGRVALHGRVASLLEVGTGFHPELTGRENVYLNGAILGMKRREIDHKFDQIVAFAEIERFLDTPVKRYSSGMYVRLAFAVAAYLESEILLVDEVLAVGDAAFQKKCLGTMSDVARDGRTVLFVSHNMSAIMSLCTQAKLMEAGQLATSGDTSQVVSRYMEGAFARGQIPLWRRPDRADRVGEDVTRLVFVAVSTSSGDRVIRCTDGLRIQIDYSGSKRLSRPAFLIRISDHLNQSIFMLGSEMAGGLPDDLPPSGIVTCETGPINLTPTSCVINVALLASGTIIDHVKQACVFEVEPDDFFGTGKLPNRQDALSLLAQNWSLS